MISFFNKNEFDNSTLLINIAQTYFNNNLSD